MLHADDVCLLSGPEVNTVVVDDDGVNTSVLDVRHVDDDDSFSLILSHFFTIWLVFFALTSIAALLRRPMLTQCITAAVLFGGGDIIAQQAVEGKGQQHDWARTARLSFYGGVLFGPAMTKWYQLLNRIKFPSPTKALVYRVWLDQAFLTPVAVAFFYTSMSTLEGKPGEAFERVKAAYVPTLVRNWGVYIPTQVINFSLVPPHLRFVFVSVVSLFWNTYLSYSNATVQQVDQSKSKKDVKDVGSLHSVD
ncbi:hypothetical protein CVT26_001522 [Gymnopilus dilepis]|uniref:Uncharacterized protein n=1 Tax=Gymnopilus dilepis TaxID=231916 RepID=A0A409WB24_9AGAR|nr:hypothetical protein CVT26_001522 [Gymnopilus dilepis]